MASRATTVLPLPTSPWSRRSIRLSACHVGVDFLERSGLRAGEREGQGGGHAFAQAPVAADGAARQLPLVLPDHRERQLIRQKFVEGQPAAWRRHGRQVGIVARVMDRLQCRAPCRPLAPRQPRGVLPFRQVLRRGQGRRHRLPQHLGRQPGGHRVDRLHRVELPLGVGRYDMVGMRHLGHAVEPLDLAADHDGIADGKLLQQPVATGMEEGQVDLAGLVGAADLIGMARIRGSRMVLHAHGQGRDEAIGRLRHMGSEPAVDDPGRQVPQQVGDMRADQLFRQLSKLRTQALQRRDGCEQGKKNIWPQRAPS